MKRLSHDFPDPLLLPLCPIREKTDSPGEVQSAPDEAPKRKVQHKQALEVEPLLVRGAEQ
eukprot:CAMPEP_0204017876 /NCGR_PEP_ID=MMETSP0360-20130528/27703_1 /ASSEMBLY_ACC=CAM_ASM_000342 /TAXON_ID=268821 /ORGANISM="Scrippsiella Hangoei, Strain SHTV-5" /LENGTH=59 /DNA_ID=CAMNT_0050960967 /DNA_START=117 /DNA_END=293 /DNA_ORIENTATION=+